jgi:hypothetical protein
MVERNNIKQSFNQTAEMKDMDSQIELSELTDVQKTYITQMSYLDFNDEGAEKIRSGGMMLSELKDYLANPDAPFCGQAFLNDQGFDKTSQALFGADAVPTDAELLQQLVDMGLGGLKIDDVISDQSTGFQALSFKDAAGNVGISFRGSDLDGSRGAIHDWVKADALEYITGNSEQKQQALDMFNQHKSQDGNNYLYGHSLGGNLTSHVFVENYNEIAEAFTINGNPINQKALDTLEKIEAFNGPKYNCNIICGDAVGNLKSCAMYQDNVNYIKNNDNFTPSIISAHLVQSAGFDKDGNFVRTNRAEMQQRLEGNGERCLEFIQQVRESMNTIEDGLAACGDLLEQKYPKVAQFANFASNFIKEMEQGLFANSQSLDINLSQDMRQTQSTPQEAPSDISSLFNAQTAVAVAELFAMEEIAPAIIAVEVLDEFGIIDKQEIVNGITDVVETLVPIDEIAEKLDQIFDPRGTIDLNIDDIEQDIDDPTFGPSLG